MYMAGRLVFALANKCLRCVCGVRYRRRRSLGGKGHCAAIARRATMQSDDGQSLLITVENLTDGKPEQARARAGVGGATAALKLLLSVTAWGQGGL